MAKQVLNYYKYKVVPRVLNKLQYKYNINGLPQLQR